MRREWLWDAVLWSHRVSLTVVVAVVVVHGLIESLCVCVSVVDGISGCCCCCVLMLLLLFGGIELFGMLIYFLWRGFPLGQNRRTGFWCDGRIELCGGKNRCGSKCLNGNFVVAIDPCSTFEELVCDVCLLGSYSVLWCEWEMVGTSVVVATIALDERLKRDTINTYTGHYRIGFTSSVRIICRGCVLRFTGNVFVFPHSVNPIVLQFSSESALEGKQ